jgi:hypothetical protein
VIPFYQEEKAADLQRRLKAGKLRENINRNTRAKGGTPSLLQNKRKKQ